MEQPISSAYFYYFQSFQSGNSFDSYRHQVIVEIHKKSHCDFSNSIKGIRHTQRSLSHLKFKNMEIDKIPLRHSPDSIEFNEQFPIDSFLIALIGLTMNIMSIDNF